MPDASRRAQEAVSCAKERNFEREAVTDERDIMRDALRRGMGDLTFSQVRENFELRDGGGEFQTVDAQLCDALGACTEFNPVYRRRLNMALNEMQFIEHPYRSTRPRDGDFALAASGCCAAPG